ncbi:hypothetical protein GW17_00047116 [Ensete ventricosum]|nr:hypothetical protein GW17_00047116 [Ensete ventricosum]
MEGHSSSRENTSFWQFSDQLRLHTSTFSNLSLGDSIWSDSFDARRTDERRNLDSSAPLPADFSANPWKMTYSNHKLAFGTYNNYNSQLNRYNTVDDNGKPNNDGVRVVTRKICDPLEEDAFRPILHHYDGPKFRLELNVEEVHESSSLTSCYGRRDVTQLFLSSGTEAP